MGGSGVGADEAKLEAAISAGDKPTTLQHILARGNVVEKAGNLLHAALVTGQVASALALLRHGRLQLGRRDSFLLIVVLQVDRGAMQLEVLRLLLHTGVLQGMDVNYIHHGEEGDEDADCDAVFTPLAYALRRRLPECAHLLLRYGADPSISLGSLYQGRYSPFAEWCRQVLLTQTEAQSPAPKRSPKLTPGSSLARMSADDNVMEKEFQERSVELPRQLLCGQHQHYFSSAGKSRFRHKVLARASRNRSGSNSSTSSRSGASGSRSGGLASARTGSMSAGMTRHAISDALRSFQRDSSMRGVACERTPDFHSRSQATRERLRAPPPMCSAELASAMFACGANANEAVGQSEVFQVTGIPALQHCLAWPGVVHEMLKNGAHPEGNPRFALPPLLQACDSMHTPWETVSLLLEAGASVHATPRFQEAHRQEGSAEAQDSNKGQRARSISSPDAPKHAPQDQAMTAYEALCGRLLDELGQDEHGEAVDLPPGTLLPVDVERIGMLLVRRGTPTPIVESNLRMLAVPAPHASRAMSRIAHWERRRDLLLCRAQVQDASAVMETGSSTQEHSTKSAPALGAVQPGPGGAIITSRQLLLGQVPAGKAPSRTKAIPVPKKPTTPKRSGSGRPRSVSKPTKLSPGTLSLGPASPGTRRYTFSSSPVSSRSHGSSRIPSSVLASAHKPPAADRRAGLQVEPHHTSTPHGSASSDPAHLQEKEPSA